MQTWSRSGAAEIGAPPGPSYAGLPTEKCRAAISTGISLRPSSDNRYSTRGGFSPKSVLSTNRSASNSRKCCVSIFCEMPRMSRISCDDRIAGSAKRRKRIGSFQRPWIILTTRATCATAPSGPRQALRLSIASGTLKYVLVSLTDSIDLAPDQQHEMGDKR